MGGKHGGEALDHCREFGGQGEMAELKLGKKLRNERDCRGERLLKCAACWADVEDKCDIVVGQI